MRKVVVYLLIVKLCFGAAFGALNSDDFAGLQALKYQWSNLPPSWNTSHNNPCRKWVGISCRKSRVTEIKLSTMEIKGTLSGDIGQFTQLEVLDLSQNKDLGGPLLAAIGKLTKLTRLILAGCSFSGTIPDTIGELTNLRFLDLNSNHFHGELPPSLGKLTRMSWFDLSNNSLSGPLPVSTDTQPGLDQLLDTKHFHLNQNQLSGSIPESLFSSKMKVIHVLFDGNQLSGSIPETLGLVQTLEILRLDRNSLKGPVPSNLNNLSKLYELNLANNKLSGPLPDLSRMSPLQFVDLSNNTFDLSEGPAWFTDLQALTTLIISPGNLRGDVPPALFSLPAIQQVILDDNWFGGSLDIGSISRDLKHVSLRRNNITEVVTPKLDYNVSVMLFGNPLCNRADTRTSLIEKYCNLTQKLPEPYSPNVTRCNRSPCPWDQSLNPQGYCTCPTNQSLNPLDCTCAYPYQGQLVFRAPIFHEMPNHSFFYSLENSLAKQLTRATYLCNPFLNKDDSYLQVELKLFPSGDQMRFSRSDVSDIGFDLNNHTYSLLKELGPYNFFASPYMYFSNDTDVTGSGGSAKKIGLIVGLSVALPLLVALTAAALYAFKHKKKAERAMQRSATFENSARTPKLKGARWFSYDELRISTNDFAQNNEIGSGGYGKVYRGVLPHGQLLAIKRAHQGSVQRSNEFNTEIELLSRVHHKNLATLVGFCFDQGEQMLVYEFIPNGSLRDSLSGKSGVNLDWRRRLRVALGSARGLAYLHELADPPIIHRDVKSANILLDENLNAKVSDFGLSKLVRDTGRGPVSSQVKGTLGYLDPEYYMTQQLTEKSDVYGFGVVMLELVTGKPPLERGSYIVREVRALLDRADEQFWGLSAIVDRKIILLTANTPVAFTTFVQLALRCSEELAINRPTMNQVVKEIESMLQLSDTESSRTPPSSASASASDSTTGRFHPKGAVIRHPYMDSFGSISSLDYSGGYPASTRVQPK